MLAISPSIVEEYGDIPAAVSLWSAFASAEAMSAPAALRALSMIESIHRVLAAEGETGPEVPGAGAAGVVGAGVVAVGTEVGTGEGAGVVTATGTGATGACVLGEEAVGWDLGGE
jgi:hypothetical protein